MSPINSLGFDIESRILFLRGRRVIIDFDLAELYGVTIKRLREQIRRNPERFPDEFMLTLNFREKDEVAAKCGDLGNLRFSRTLALCFYRIWRLDGGKHPEQRLGDSGQHRGYQSFRPHA